MKPASALRLLHWVVLAFVLIGARTRLGAGRPSARSRPDARGARPPPKRRSGTRTSPTPICRRLRAENDALGLALQGAIADLTPRLAASAKRLAELTPKSGETAPTTDVAAKELESEKQRHDTLDANLRAARAMLLEADDLSHPHQRGAAPIVRAPNLRPVVERPQSAALGRRLAGSSDRRRGDAEPDRQLARRASANG